jgi:hypothetical protein
VDVIPREINRFAPATTEPRQDTAISRPFLRIGARTAAIRPFFSPKNGQAVASKSNLRWLQVQDWHLRRFGPYDRKSRRVQLSIRYGDRDYDRSIAGLGTGKAQRYFASDFDRLSSRWFDANGIAAVSRRRRRAAVLHAFGQYSIAVLDRGR